VVINLEEIKKQLKINRVKQESDFSLSVYLLEQNKSKVKQKPFSNFSGAGKLK